MEDVVSAIARRLSLDVDALTANRYRKRVKVPFERRFVYGDSELAQTPLARWSPATSLNSDTAARAAAAASGCVCTCA